MSLRELLSYVAANYDRASGTNALPQQRLRNVSKEIAEILPIGYVVEGHGGLGRATLTPWIGILNPDLTPDPKQGTYLVYFFNVDLNAVTLSLQQGSEKLIEDVGRANARTTLSDRAQALRYRLGSSLAPGLADGFDLGAGNGWRQLSYQAGSIANITYQLTSLPSEQELKSDLDLFVELLEKINAPRLTSSVQQITKGASTDNVEPAGDVFDNFKPKSSDEYVAEIKAKTLVKSRRHESLLREYGTAVANRGWVPSTKEHPLDLTLRASMPRASGPTRVVVEAKVVRRGNATIAVREAIGQLFTYQAMLIPRTERTHTQLAALFSEEIGRTYVWLLEELGIAAVWFQAGRWSGSPQALELSLA